jgi:predicted nucleic acid-binding protein
MTRQDRSVLDRFMLDTGVFHELENRPDVEQKLRNLRDGGKVILLSTHIQRDQLTAAPDGHRRERLRAELTLLVPTWGFVLDVSTLNESDFIPEEGTADFEQKLRTPWRPLPNPLNCLRLFRWRHTADALIAHTAKREEATLVTRETGRMLRAPERIGVKTMHVTEFFAWVLDRS